MDRGRLLSAEIRVLIVDDHVVVREGTELLLADFEHIKVVGKASNGDEALAKISDLRPDVVLLDLLMPGPEPVDVIRSALATQSDVRMLVVTASTEQDAVLEAIRAGAMGYLSKNADRQDYLRAIERLHRGEAFLPAELTRELIRDTTGDGDPALTGLTEREREILRLVALGWDNHRIADHFGIAEVTARTHLSRLLSKIGVSNRVEAAVFAFRHGLARLDEAAED